jgi:hypothetical protein
MFWWMILRETGDDDSSVCPTKERTTMERTGLGPPDADLAHCLDRTPVCE